MNSTAPHCPNPFTCDVGMLRSLLVSLLDEVPPDAGDPVFRRRAVALVGAVAPVLAWVRDCKGVRIDLRQSYFAMELPNMQALVASRVFRNHASVDGLVIETPVADMPEALIRPVQAYLDMLLDFDPSRPWDGPGTALARQQHSYALSYLAQAHPRNGPAAIEA